MAGVDVLVTALGASSFLCRLHHASPTSIPPNNAISRFSPPEGGNREERAGGCSEIGTGTSGDGGGGREGDWGGTSRARASGIRGSVGLSLRAEESAGSMAASKVEQRVPYAPLMLLLRDSLQQPELQVHVEVQAHSPH